jgi:hypothetical protein
METSILIKSIDGFVSKCSNIICSVATKIALHLFKSSEYTVPPLGQSHALSS